MSNTTATRPMADKYKNMQWRKVRATWRDTWLLFRQFRWPLLAFVFAILGGGGLYYILAQQVGEPIDNIFEAFYLVLSLTFMQSIGEFPDIWYLEVFYFVMPVIGIVILAQGVTEFGVMLFNRRARGKEWEMAVASTFNGHIVLIGLGHLGFRVARNLSDMNQDVVVIELNPNADLVTSAQGMGIPVIQDDGSRETALEAAGVRRASAIILCTQNDSLNLKIALKARYLKPDIRVVLRIFDDDFAQALHEQFGFTAFSATGMAAPAFASAASGADMTRPITIEGETLSLARLKISSHSRLIGVTAGQIEQQYNVSVVFLRRDNESDLHPSGDLMLKDGDAIAILGGPAEISLLAKDNLPS